ncbi:MULTISPECIES: glycerol-3-phosphate 1-O-acyltransferase PlsB [Actinobacillus]|uniref:Glycerol-3-phosphate acyltransferase n=1 Tax=Actinobacillus lignieresii TaxID=720 RepID=A0A380TYA8_ACTLI|nr:MULTISPECIES: glycerol-3-phosphate 1-O-acyltransferase PlsB [Actinobacillus]EFM93853.1 Glycerol-3-phosphate acyltransferase [Actinobacillus pleuropneumoniae serovar 9 str. CVJ13261]EFM98239.1 Glycerol-3-phosphate acyltransferase [Actinobacillus pleuropneumoniae serovar 11 str. 56153]MCL7709883.1 glycerol-3-phosphate 1-O-acyltransferase PlsB [Actinobacillus pleuropneumoniae]MCL7711735.1 glycerol-3-phosphate 1-O-acyltransferase PlsB [Actinobacillus pleuropneumoniae]MCL7716008.1 glycerol-3-pho
MSSLLNFYRKVLNVPLSLLVKSRAIPTDPVKELNLNLEQPIIYVLPYTSQTDLLILQKNCLALNLPDPLQNNELNGQSLPRYVFLDEGRRFFKSKGAKSETESIFYRYLDLHRNNESLDVQLIPASVLWGRSPGKESEPHLRLMSSFQRIISMIWFGRDNFVRFSQALSLKYMVAEHGADEGIAQKLARVAKIHFAKQRYSAMGPRLPDRQAMFNKIIQSPAIKAAIEEEAKTKKISIEKARQEAEKIVNEIAADVSHESLRIADRVLSWLWNKLYQGINVQNGDRVRKLALEGHEIVYVPCHRSHMDYLLLSYLLYHQGLVPPHIAAGINLNFFPAGPIFRSWGAFFIRRTFKGNRLYSTIFREYLAELFYRGYSVEYFIEGGRSRTGRLLEPKTGMMSMTLQALQRGLTRPISIVPVYIGYEHVLEVDTYAKELRGAEKEKENAGLVLRVIKKLKNLGQCYVNFAEPIQVNNYLNQHFPEWKESQAEDSRPKWLNEAVDSVAHQVMININKAAAINAKNLIGSVLLASRQRALAREQLIEQVDSYLQLFKNVSYSDDVIVPNDSAEEMLNHVLTLPRSGVISEKDSFGEMIRLDRESAVLMTYYRNNIQHLFVLPSLVASIILHHESVSKDLIIKTVNRIYPFLKAELFLHFEENDVRNQVEAILTEFSAQRIVKYESDVLQINRVRVRALQLHAAGVREILQRYYISLSILLEHPEISRAALEKESRSIAQRLSILHGINAPEFFDKALFSTFSASLKAQGYFDSEGNCILEKAKEAEEILRSLISVEVQLTIQGAMEKVEEVENTETVVKTAEAVTEKNE